MRQLTKKIAVGNTFIGGDAPILLQSMCNTHTEDAKATIAQILDLEKLGCDIIRVTVPTREAADNISYIKKHIHIPLVADIHFDYTLALESIKQGVDKIRINPGNIGGKEKIEQVVNACKERGIPIRVGINGGSLEKDILHKYNDQATPEALVESAMRNVRLVEDCHFSDIIISVKSSDVLTTIESYRLLSQQSDYPLHLGVTEAGTLKGGTVKSLLGIGTLLAEGIGDTFRVSLTADPKEEILLGWNILKNLKIREKGVKFTSCPGCGRTEIALEKIAQEIEEYCENIDQTLHISVMGCVVNGPGEALHADIGLVGGKGRVAIYEKGKVIHTCEEKEALPFVKELIDKKTCKAQKK